MTAHSKVAVQQGTEIVVPLNKLVASPRNARRTPHVASDVEALAASIAVKGLLQPPVVEPERNEEGRETGRYLVTIGEGRRLALLALAARKQIAKSAPVRCLLDVANDAFEISLDENVTRFAMHPADQFKAFQELAGQKGWSAEQIADRFGVTAHLVRQRWRLAAVSPTLMAAYREGELSLDVLMAFTVSEDHERQEQVYASLSFNRSPSVIRRLLTESAVEATDFRAVFVGVEAYEAVGGRVRRDLFAEDHGGWFEDVALLEQLAHDRLVAEAERVGSEEGWAWAEVRLTLPHDHGLRRVYGRTPQHDVETEARLSALGDEYDRLVEGCNDEADLSETDNARLQEIDAELQAASRAVFDPDVRARAGVFVTLDWEGAVRVERAFVKPEDEPPPPEGWSNETGADATVAKGGPKPMAEKLLADLTAQRTGALRDRLAQDSETALLVALHSLAVHLFDYYGASTPLELRALTTTLERHAEGFEDSVAGRAIEARHEAFARDLPEDGETLWDGLSKLGHDHRLKLFAHCIALTLNAVRTDERCDPVVDSLAARLGLDMTAYWRADAAFFGRISKAQILDAVREVKPEEAARLEGLKKGQMAQVAADLLGSEGWLPPLLRSAAAPPA